MKKSIVVLSIAAMFAFSGTVLADQIYGGIGLNPASGQSNYVTDGYMNLNLAYEPSSENLAGWRFSYALANFKHTDDDSYTIKSHIFSAEQLHIIEINPRLALIGAFGPGLFLTSVKSDNSRNGMSIGLSATGSIRYAFLETMFIEGAYVYKNCAVKIDDWAVDGGYQGLFINVGVIF